MICSVDFSCHFNGIFPQALWGCEQNVPGVDSRASVHALSFWVPCLHGGV